MNFQYPRVKRTTNVDHYHGAEIPDPYSWLEDPDSDETRSFVQSQNALTFSFLENCGFRQKVKERLTEMWDFPKYGCPFRRGNKYFYFYNTGLQNQNILYMQHALDGEAQLLLDPNKFSEDGTSSLRGYSFSEDGTFLSYGISKSGSDWVTIKFMKIDPIVHLDDILVRVKFSCISWTHDNKGIFYNKYPINNEEKADGTETATNLNQKLYYHFIGNHQSDDILCAEFPNNPKWLSCAEISNDGQYILLSISEGCDPVNRLYYCDLMSLNYEIKGLVPWIKLINNFDAQYEYINNEGTIFTFKTNIKSPKYKIINIDINSPQMENWTDLVPELEMDVLEWSTCVNHTQLVLCYLHDVKNQLYLHELSSGKFITSFNLDVGSITGYSGRKKDTEIFYQFKSFLTPGIIYHCDLVNPLLAPTIFKQIKINGFNQDEFKISQIFYNSKDDTKIPMFLVYRKNLELDGTAPVFLYGYGGFNISILPNFSVAWNVFMQSFNGILAIANIRGGGEYGEDWHQGGMLSKKQNCFDDFHAAAEWLVVNKYTQARKIVICGGSNGGLLVAACTNQRPDLYGCMIAQVGVMDMLKFHKFTIGHAWISDYGCSDIKEQYEWLIKYSPLHNVVFPKESNTQYPSVLLLTADHDDRVVPLHSLKYISQLQYIIGKEKLQTNPLLIRIDTKSGHGAGKPVSKMIEEYADIYAFIAENLKLSWHQ